MNHILGGWVVFQNPICVFRVRDEIAVPFYLKMARRSFKKRWSWEAMDIKLGHCRF
jgi:hypothetical protein